MSTSTLQAIIIPSTLTAKVGDTVTLDGSPSTGQIAEYAWWQPTGTTVVDGLPHTDKVTFVVPSNQVDGKEVVQLLTFTLEVTDPNKNRSFAQATVVVPGDENPSKDAFGHKLIYALTGDGSKWAMDMNDPGSDPRGKNPESSSYMPHFIKNADGSWKITNQTEIRWAITADDGFDESKLCTDFTKCRNQGYMMTPKDWGSNSAKGHMLRAYYRINAVSSSSHNGEGHLEHVMRGQRSTTSNSTFGGPCTCAIGCSDNYHCNCYCNKGSDGPARQKYEKDLFHTSGYSKDINGVNNNTAYNFKKGQWFGLTTIVYNLPDGSVQLEHWTDENADDNWKKTHSMADRDQWPPRGAIGNCNLPHSASGSPPITFGGPLSVFRSDNLVDYDIKDAVIVSIDKTKPLMGPAHIVETISHVSAADAVIDETGAEIISKP